MIVISRVKRLNPYLSAKSCPDFGREVLLERMSNCAPREMIVVLLLQVRYRIRLIEYVLMECVLKAAPFGVGILSFYNKRNTFLVVY